MLRTRGRQHGSLQSACNLATAHGWSATGWAARRRRGDVSRGGGAPRVPAGTLGLTRPCSCAGDSSQSFKKLFKNKFDSQQYIRTPPPCIATKTKPKTHRFWWRVWRDPDPQGPIIAPPPSGSAGAFALLRRRHFGPERPTCSVSVSVF